MQKKITVGPKGEVVIPKEIREKIGIKEYSELIIDILDDSVIIRKIKPESVSYVNFYSTTYSRKLKKKIDIKKIAESNKNFTWVPTLLESASSIQINNTSVAIYNKLQPLFTTLIPDLNIEIYQYFTGSPSTITAAAALNTAAQKWSTYIKDQGITL